MPLAAPPTTTQSPPHSGWNSVTVFTHYKEKITLQKKKSTGCMQSTGCMVQGAVAVRARCQPPCNAINSGMHFTNSGFCVVLAFLRPVSGCEVIGQNTEPTSAESVYRSALQECRYQLSMAVSTDTLKGTPARVLTIGSC